LRGFEQGLLSPGLVLGIVAAICGFAALAAVWLHPGVPLRAKLMRSAVCVTIAAAVVASATQIGRSIGLTQDRRNSLPPPLPRPRSAPARRGTRAADHHGSSRSGRSALRRSAAQYSPQARAGRAPRHHPARHHGPKRGRQHERGSLRRDRVLLWRPLGQEPLDQPSRNPAAHLRVGGTAGSDAHPPRGGSRLPPAPPRIAPPPL